MKQIINLQFIKDMLKSMSEKDKDGFIIWLYKVPAIEKYINERLWGIDFNAYYEKAIKTIDTYIFGRSWERLEKWKAKKGIANYYEATKDPVGRIKLMLYYIERMEQFTREFGGIDEWFYISIEETFAKALRYIDQENLQKDFYPEVKTFSHSVMNFWYGRWFSDQIRYYYYERVHKNNLAP